MDRVAEVAQVSKLTVYRHFPSKDDLYQAITHELVLREHYPIDGSYGKTQRLRCQLIRIAIQEVAAFSSETYLVTIRVLLAEAFRSPEIAQKAVQDLPALTGEHYSLSWSLGLPFNSCRYDRARRSGNL